MAFVGGLIAFITPCVLPLVPVYLSILSGASFDQLTGRGGELSADERRDIHRRVLANAIAFIIGFSMVFIALGFVSGTVGALLVKWGGYLIRVIGVLLVLLGLNMAGFWKPRFLSTETRFQMQKGRFGLISSCIIGAVFAFGWSPCVGPILAPILAMAASTGNKLQGAALLATFSLGLAVPFFLSALSVNGLIAFTNKMKRHFHTMEIIVGVILILIGLFLAIAGLEGLDNVRARLGWFERISTSAEERVVGVDEESATEHLEEMEVDEETVVVFDEEPDMEEPHEEEPVAKMPGAGGA